MNYFEFIKFYYIYVLHEKNDFEIFKNLVRYRFENNFFGPSK